MIGPAWHLVKRFAGSLRTGPLPSTEEVWARRRLLPGERELWNRLSNPDRRHALGVATDVVDRLGPDIDRAVVAAALLHDVGKVVAGLGTPARVAATLWWTVATEDTARRWAARPEGPARRFGQYRLHPELGAGLLVEAGSDPLTSTWAAEHHLPPDRWTVPAEIGAVLKACDDD
ncbi:MAG: HD domain-containing protein [Acidimicrobiia bacterium]|nr:HD domain-containing protein [Acidimicrobiia bacterium]